MPTCAFSLMRAEQIKQALNFWRSDSNSQKKLFSRKDLDLLNFAHLLPNLVLSDVHKDPLHLRYKLVGTNIVELFGNDFSGKDSRELFGHENWRSTWEPIYQRVVYDKIPLYGRDTLSHVGRSHVGHEWCILPLADDRNDIVSTLTVMAQCNLNEVPGATPQITEASASDKRTASLPGVQAQSNEIRLPNSI